MDLAKDKIFDLIIVGAGMMGSAAARHASLIPNTSVCLIGPQEPKIRKGHQIFGCWFDEGRICRRVSAMHTWSNLATHSIARFRDLEDDTGINFYTESGYMDINPSQEEFNEMMEASHKAGLAAKDISQSWKEKFPYFNISKDKYVMLEEENAGHINPRALVSAQQTAAHLHGAYIIRDIVETIKPAEKNKEKVRWLVVTESGKELQGNNVLVAAGGFAGLKHLFASVAPRRQPALQLRTQTIAFLKLPQEEVKRLRQS
ncbi:unnamed protein product [Meganyctiphanes norvegica]|uniref:FAD dependent oxidoreductase domain-containing protein n=1 Tax=Meganyctiphanes norvegica TaxID=48144 RepID=A0AAV2QHD9_MEGNR